MANQIIRNVYVLQKSYMQPIDYKQATNTIPISFVFQDFSIPEGATAAIYVTKPSGNATYDSGTISGNTVTFTPTNQTFSEAGRSELQVDIQSGSDLLATFNVLVNVQENLNTGDVPESQNQSPLLQQYINQMNKSIEDMTNLINDVQGKLESGAFNGPQGQPGEAATVEVGTVETLPAGSQATVENVGTSSDAVLNFGIPQGTSGGATLDSVYPVGSIYMSVVNTNPGTLFGGTWEAWGQGRVPVGVDADNDDFNTVEQQGGEYTHTLTEQELASHTHTQDPHTHDLGDHTHDFSATTDQDGTHTHTGRWLAMNTQSSPSGSYLVRRIDAGDSYDGTSQVTNDAGAHTHNVSGTTGEATGDTGQQTATNQSAGGGQAHNNVQPYITCYMWKRTA